MTKKLSKLDRAEALLRISEYKRDLDRLLQFRERSKKKEAAFIKKYASVTCDPSEGETVFFPTPGHGKEFKKLKEKEIYKYLQKERALLKKYGLITLITPFLVERLKNPKVTGFHKKTGKLIPHDMLQKEAPKMIEREREKIIQHEALFVQKPWIVSIEIDLNKSEEYSKFIAERHIKALYHLVEKNRERPKDRYRRELTYDPWIIYDMRYKDKLNLSQIAKKLSGVNQNPSHNSIVMAVYKAATRACEKAKEMLQQVRDDIKIN